MSQAVRFSHACQQGKRGLVRPGVREVGGKPGWRLCNGKAGNRDVDKPCRHGFSRDGIPVLRPPSSVPRPPSRLVRSSCRRLWWQCSSTSSFRRAGAQCGWDRSAKQGLGWGGADSREFSGDRCPYLQSRTLMVFVEWQHDAFYLP